MTTLFDTTPPVDPHLAAADVARLSAANRELLRRLNVGPCTNIELAPTVGLRVSARVHDLRQAGYVIDAERGARGLWRYTLKGRAA